MEKKIEELLKDLPNEHKELAIFSHHLYEQLEEEKSEHFKQTAAIAMNGGAPKGASEQAFFNSLNKCKNIIIDELKRAHEHIDQIEDHYLDNVHIEKIQLIKDRLGNHHHTGLILFAQELIKRFSDEKEEHYKEIGKKFLHNQNVEKDTEKVHIELISKIEGHIITHLEKTTEDIVNQNNPNYKRHYLDRLN